MHAKLFWAVKGTFTLVNILLLVFAYICFIDYHKLNIIQEVEKSTLKSKRLNLKVLHLEDHEWCDEPN